MKTRILAVIALTCGLFGACLAQSSPAGATTTKAAGSAPYNEGSVWTLSMVKTKTGLDDEYLKQITGTVKPVYDEEKKQKIILDYKILMGDSHGRDEANIIIMVEYPNMAAMDGLREKTEPIFDKIMGTEDQQRQMAVKRVEIREIMGNKLMREITLK